MSIFNLGKLRIGTKLGLSAGVGVVLVVGMVASGQIQNVGRDQAAAEIKSSYELRGAIAAFELTTHAANGITRNDFVMAAKLDQLAV